MMEPTRFVMIEQFAAHVGCLTGEIRRLWREGVIAPNGIVHRRAGHDTSLWLTDRPDLSLIREAVTLNQAFGELKRTNHQTGARESKGSR